MPQSSEALLISSLVRTRDHLSVTSLGLDISMFHSHPEEWKWITQYVRRHRKMPSKQALRNRFPQFKIYAVDDTEHYAEEVRSDHKRFLLVQMLEDTATRLQAGEDPDKIIPDIGQTFRTLANGHHIDTKLDIIENWRDIFDDALRRVTRTIEDGSPGIPTGFETLDLGTGGVQPGHLWVVAARLGKGKTWTAVRMACSALVSGYSPLYFSLEQSKASIGFRAHTFLSATYNRETFKNLDLNKGENLSLLEYRKFLARLKKLVKGNFYVSDSSRGRITPEIIGAQIESVKPDIVFIDYLTLMARDTPDWQGVSMLMNDIKAVAERYQTPIVLLSQVNRVGNGKEPPGTEHLSQSDAVGQDADAVITIARVSEHVVKMKLAKFRHGLDGQTWYAEFDVNNGQYREISGDEADQIEQMDASAI